MRGHLPRFFYYSEAFPPESVYNPCVLIADRLRALREAKKLSQGDIQRRTGLLPPYLSRIENGHTVPSVETLEKLSRALEVPLYQLFYDGEEPPEVPHLPKRLTGAEIAFGSSKKEARYVNTLRRLLSRMTEPKRQLLFHLAQKLARR